MIVDGFGERGTIAYYTYRDGQISLIKQHKGQESLGALYMLITDLCGFSTFKGEEWKVMGLAPYGRFSSAIYDQIRSIVEVHGCDIRYSSRRKLRHAMQNLESFRRRKDSSPLDAADLAYNGQLVFSEIMNALLKHFHELTHANNLILGGGCALNSSYVGSILENTGFKNLHVPCAPTDDGNALGAALLAYEKLNTRRSARLPIPSPYLGSSICPGTLRRLAETGDPKRTRHLPGRVHRETARILAEGKIVGWIQGRAEFGPRALGDRSILADPRPSDMKERINKMVKFRENFRPFAPSILHEYGNEYFENYQESPYMERVLRFRKEVVHKVPAVVHVDRTGRLQTVKRSWNKRFYELIEEFYKLTQIPILLNTSFNVMGKPMIHSVEDALGVFYTTGLDALVIEDYLLEK
jgi:carbamoyltransferase